MHADQCGLRFLVQWLMRYSIPFFMHFNSDFVIDALDDCVSEERPRKWAPITADAYLRERLIEIGLLPAED